MSSGGLVLPPDELADKWSTSWTPREVADRLRSVTTPWYVAAGWALELFRDAHPREHGDIEIGVPAGGFDEIRRCFTGLVFDAAGDGRVWPNATADQLAATHQTWLREPATGKYLLDVFREPHDGDIWICRHDETIRRRYTEIVHRTGDGIPYLAPEFVLLFKAKHPRPKDDADLAATLPYLSATQHRDLTELVARVHPGHRWLDTLTTGGISEM